MYNYRHPTPCGARKASVAEILPAKVVEGLARTRHPAQVSVTVPKVTQLVLAVMLALVVEAGVGSNEQGEY